MKLYQQLQKWSETDLLLAKLLRNLNVTLDRFNIIKPSERNSCAEFLLKLAEFQEIPQAGDLETKKALEMWSFFKNLNGANHLKIQNFSKEI